MTISTYADLQSAAAAWVDRTDLTARLPDFIQFCEAKLNRTLRITRMIQRSSAVIGTDNRYSSVPDDYLETITYVMDDGITPYRMDPVPIYEMTQFRALNDQPSRPRFYAINATVQGREFEHYPTPDKPYTGELTYYGRIPALSASNTTIWLLTDAPDVYLYGTLLQIAPYLRDSDQLQVWSAGYLAAVEELKTMDHAIAGKLRTDPAMTYRRQGIYDIFRDY